MRKFITIRAAVALAVALGATAALAQAPSRTDQQILAVAAQFEKAANGNLPQVDQRKLKEAAEYLRDLARGTRKNDNTRLLDFNDDPAKFSGKTLTFEMQLSEPGADGLREVPRDRAQLILSGRAGNPPASVKIVVDYADILDKVPNAHQGDRIIVTFDCLAGSVKNGNVAKSIARP